MTDEELFKHGIAVLSAPRTVFVRVTKGDYAYDGYLVGVTIKRSGQIRATVEDNCGRLFIHNAKELEHRE